MVVVYMPMQQTLTVLHNKSTNKPNLWPVMNSTYRNEFLTIDTAFQATSRNSTPFRPAYFLHMQTLDPKYFLRT